MSKTAILFLAAACVPAQTRPEPPKPGKVTVTGSFRSRLEMWNWFDGAANDSYAFSGNILRVSVARTMEKMDWQVEFAAPFLLGLPKDAIAPAPQAQFGLGGNYFAANKARQNAAMVFPKQAFVRFKNLGGVKGQSLRLGRFEFSDGAETTPANTTLAALKTARINQRLIGPFAWPHVGRSFDGAHYTLTKGKITYTGLGVLATRGVFQVDGWGNLATAFAYGSAAGPVGKGKNVGEWRLLGIYYDDWRPIAKVDNRPAPARLADLAAVRIATWGGHYLHESATSEGPVNFLLWGVAQRGKWGRLDHSAFAIDLEAGWQPRVLPKLRPWLAGGFSHASGDGNPADGKHGGFHQLLPTPRPFARFPFFNMMNNQDRFGMLTLRPHKAITTRGEFHALRLSNARDLWYLGGGAFQPWTFGYVGRNTNGARSLANLFDLSVDWNVNAKVAFSFYVGHAQGRSAMRAIYPRGTNAEFGYLEMLYKF